MNAGEETLVGRVIAGNAGILVTRVINVKDTGAKTFVIVDAAMNDLLRPTLYEAFHRIGPVIVTRDHNDFGVWGQLQNFLEQVETFGSIRRVRGQP